MVPISKSIWQLILFVYLNFYFMSMVRFNLLYCFSKIFFRKRSKASPPNFAPPFCALCLIVCDFLPKTWNLGRKKRNPPPLVKTQCRAARRLPDIALIINNSSADNAQSNDDDRRQRRKQGGVVGAAASKTRVPPKARCGCWVPQPGRRGAHFKSSSTRCP